VKRPAISAWLFEKTSRWIKTGGRFPIGTRQHKRSQMPVLMTAHDVHPDIRLYVAPSSIDGKGLFSSSRIPARKKLGEFSGEVITQREARSRARGRHKIAIVELNDGRAIDAARGGNCFRYINHSCSPNAYIRICYGHVEFYSRREIRPGEEITCDYGETHHEGTLPCQCGSEECRGFL
jgi:SET domain-containing protein